MTKNLGDVSDILFWSGAREREEAFEEVARRAVLRKTRGRGGVSEEEAREGEVRRGNVVGGGGGELNFFSGPEMPTKKNLG